MAGGENAGGGGGAVRHLLGSHPHRQRADRLRLPAAPQGRHSQAPEHRVPSDGLL